MWQTISIFYCNISCSLYAIVCYKGDKCKKINDLTIRTNCLITSCNIERAGLIFQVDTLKFQLLRRFSHKLRRTIRHNCKNVITTYSCSYLSLKYQHFVGITDVYAQYALHARGRSCVAPAAFISTQCHTASLQFLQPSL